MPESTEEEWERWEELMTEHGGTRAECAARFASTVAQIQTERETAWLNGEEE